MNEQVDAPPAMKIILPRLTGDELFLLACHCEEKILQGRFSSTPKWLKGILRDEIERRSDESKEPAMITLPNWTNCELAEALIFTYCLVHGNLPPGIAKFADELFSHVVTNVAATLDFYGDCK